MAPRARNDGAAAVPSGRRRTMEGILEEAAASSASGASAPPSDEARASCLSFARALRDLALSEELYGGDGKESPVAAAAPGPVKASGDVGGGDDELSAWLYDLLSTLPSAGGSLSTLDLCLLVTSACEPCQDDGQVQAALFDTLGEGERAMEVLFDLAPHSSEIGRSVDEASLRRVAVARGDLPPGALLPGSSAASGGGDRVDVEAERLAILRQEAVDAAQEAAFAQAAVAAAGGGRGTHSVARESDRQAQKWAKKAAKRAAVARSAAREAGAIVDEAELAQSVLGGRAALDSEMDWGQSAAGLDGMSPSDVRQMMMGLAPEGTREYAEKKTLPAGTERDYGDGYEVVTIPAPRLDPSALPTRIELADVMPASHRKAFAGTNSLNPMQSRVFDAAYNSQENILVCAPTGAGKTNVAMLTVVAHLRDNGIIENENDPYAAYSHIDNDRPVGSSAGTVGRKIIYIAPMKALAQEVVEKFSSKLKALKIVVKELTGDMQLSRAESDRADILVTTPEKWDVITRKGGDGSLSQTCGLLIIDEVHLLADGRGAVIESIVARLHRLVESSQRQVRILGLSATLPNYKDVARFLHVQESRGLFFFGPEYRPVPLQQQYVGITEIKDRFRKEKKMNEVCYDIVADSMRRGYQVMVFVHSRRGTGDTAKALIEIATKEGELDSLFITQGKEGQAGDAYTRYADRAAKSRNAETRFLFGNGMGIHHAGMLRNDRKLTEQMFADGAIKVLCCTATLAWGVNLPAHTVVVKGTEVYNPEKGGRVDLSILDVMQIFGRAGRPQFDSSGEATLITTHDAMARYLDKLVREVPIESTFIKQLADHLNAEIVAGTVTTVEEAVEWLTYTYLYTRMLKNPLSYGINADQHADDPQLKGRCLELVRDAAKLLDERRMARFDPASGNLSVTDLGRVASHFYIRAESVATFNEMLGKLPDPTDSDLMHIICCAEEFENVKVRPDELSEVDRLKKEACPLAVRAPVEEFSGKCCVLMQAFISGTKVNSFTLISDTNYIASNAGRVARALFEMCLKRGLAGAAVKLLRIAKSVDHRLWWFLTPLRHFGNELPSNVFKALEARKADYDSYAAALSLLDMQPGEVGQLCHWHRGGEKIRRFAGSLPYLDMSCSVQPVTRGILRFQVHLKPNFTWNGRWHGGAEGFWLLVEDGDNNRIYHHEYILFSRKNHPEAMDLELSIPAFDPLPPQYFLRALSDSWVGCEILLPVSFKHVLLPHRQMPYTDLIDLTPLPTSALHEPTFEQLYSKFPTFNPIQTQLFHVLYHTDAPVLLGAPTGSGKTIVAELALLRMKQVNPKAKCVYIAPLKSLARERLKEWKTRLGSPPLNWEVLELSGDTRHDSKALNRADVLVCTPEKWDLITRGWRGNSNEFTESTSSMGKKFIREIALLVIDEIHLLGEERGAVLEAIVSRTRFISKFIEKERENPSSNGNFEATRIIGLSTALANPYDLADWIGINIDGHGTEVKRGLYNFRPSVRPIPMEVHIQGFPGRHYCPRMATMNKPCYAAIKEHSPTKPVIIFVASRRQTRLTALELISYAAGDENPTAFLGCSDDHARTLSQTLSDSSLQHTLSFGVGLHHAGLTSHDRETVEKMFLNGDIQVLVATATLAWGVNLPAHLVIVKGTEFFDGKTHRYVDYPVTDVLQMMGRAGRPQFDTHGKACVMVAEGKKNFYKKFLYEPFPVESCLGLRLAENINAEIAIGTINSIAEAVGYLSWTFFARRVKMNPSFYGAKSDNEEDIEDFFYQTIKTTAKELSAHDCIKLEDDEDKIGDNCSLTITALGLATSNYYLQYRSPKQMREGGREARNIISRRFESCEAAKGEDSGDTKVNDSFSGVEGRPYEIPLLVEEAAVAHILYVICKTHEFDEHPVRHNEEEHNAELSEEVPWGPTSDILMGKKGGGRGGRYRYDPSDEDLMADPHTKCFLLLQAHLASVKLPVTDYITDTRSVLDQVPRLLAAMQYVALDDSKASGTFDLICAFSRVRQILQKKCMVTTNPLEQLSGFPRDGVRKLKSRGFGSLRELRLLPSNDAEEALSGIFERSKRNKASLSAAMRSLNGIPLARANNRKVYCEVDKVSGKSTGVLKFDLIVSGRHNEERRRGGKRRLNNDDGLIGFTAILGTSQGRFLLSHKSIGGISIRGPKGNVEVKRAVEMKFDWNYANAHGGADGGTTVLRVICESVRGMDFEFFVPLR